MGTKDPPSSELADEMQAVIAEHVPPATAATITDDLLSHFAGSQVYFPVASRRRQRLKEIRERVAGGANLQALAREYGISYRALLIALRRG